ncbi:Chemotaxis response regulator protein-glutamate methylesterase [wastewater metagenome]|uniref:protein-glutamate methylesterase n=2 Tax=unclassified sequences TaxID=12908 RepID=A0A5B8RB56_9ZZZZ|nr:chemotaxis response regulator protein-glutamate methylesterase [Arhodomonas sp. KWT]QEA05178.1 chemotaxis response regulator protein-glutamate methylesterase [uncultured organism]
MSCRVMVVDDSAVLRQALGKRLDSEPDIELLGVAADPLFARRRMAQEWPDVIVLDVEMPRMDGITFLREIMREHPTPVVICSTLTERGSRLALEATEAGAFAVIPKPTTGLREYLDHGASELVQAVRAAGQANRHALRGPRTAPATATTPSAPLALGRTTDQIVAIGTSTGGTQALEQVLTAMPADCPGIVVVQHMPANFTRAFAERLNGLCACRVQEAASGDRVRPGLVLIAPGGQHMVLRGSGAQYHVTTSDGPPVNRHRPSVDVLFRSVARVAGGNAIGVIMTGMGGDGAAGLLAMREAGAMTLAQDEQSCVVFGMPREAIRLGAASAIVSLDDIPDRMLRTATAA